MDQLKKGVPAPEFALKDQAGNVVRLTDFAGRKLLVYFYPKASTPGCTTQACAVRDAKPDLDKYSVAAVGISPDSPSAQKRFDQKYSLGFPLLCDEDNAVAKAYGVWQKKMMFGNKYLGIVRSAFLVDEGGKIAETWYKISPKDTVPNLLNALE
jgi:thioredoxin-dependent peroxiredoxin